MLQCHRTRPRLQPLGTALRALAVAAWLSGARAGAGTPPTFHLDPDTIRADGYGTWRTALVIENKGTSGLYPDSLSVDWRNDDPDSSAAAHAGTMPLQGLAKVIAAASAGEQTGMQWTAPADFGRGLLTFRLVTHDGQKQSYTSFARAVVAGNDLYDRYPADLLRVGKQQVEVVVMNADSTRWPAPGIVYVPPSGTSARGTMRWAIPYVGRGQTLAIVSLPGSGRSSGPADRAGPASVAAVDAAIRRLARDHSVDTTRLAVWGLDDGATTALLAAVRHPELQGVIAQDASYDAWASYRALPAPGRERFVREAGRDSTGWRARSPLLVAEKIAGPVLVLQTNESAAPDSAAAVAFAQVRSDRQLFVEARMGMQESGRPFTSRDALRVAQDFLKRRLTHP